jgi:hypothetical protein
MRHKGIDQAGDDMRSTMHRQNDSDDADGGCLLPEALVNCIRPFEAKIESRAVAFQLSSSTTLLYYTNVKFNQEENRGPGMGGEQHGPTSLRTGGRRYLAFN